MEPVRIDRVHHNEKICDKVVAEIRMCQFLVADVTLQRPGVYFEAGFAMGLGRAVIWSCREDDLKNVHFDTRQYNHIVWKDPSNLRTQLTDRIKATIPGAV
jgi:nucleoside 2-deoxyribosyltransferase